MLKRLFLSPQLLGHLWSLIFTALYSCTVYGQAADFDYLTVKDGLPQSTVRSIVKDKYGFMWFGTWNGLARYDGYHFKVYRSIAGDSTSLANNRIHYIYKDSLGDLWVATFNSRISRYNYEQDNFTRFTEDEVPQAIRDSTDRKNNMQHIQAMSGFLQKQIGSFVPSSSNEHIIFNAQVNRTTGLADNNINSIYKDTSGILWLGTTTAGIGKLDLHAKKFKHIDLSLGTSGWGNIPARSVLAEDDKIWIGTNDRGLLIFDRQQQSLKQAPVQLADKSVRALFKDKKGVIWIGTRTTLTSYNPHLKTQQEYKLGVAGIAKEARFYAIAEDPIDAALWLSTFDGIYKFLPDKGQFIKQRIDREHEVSGAGCLFFDAANNLWIGAEYTGLVCLARNPKDHTLGSPVSYTRFLPDKRVYAIAEDKFGHIWAGTADGLCKINPDRQQVTVLTSKDGLADQYITKVLADQSGNIWVGHKKGLSKITGSESTIRNYAVNSAQENYEFIDGSGVALATRGELFFGGIDGVIYFNPKEIVDNSEKAIVRLTDLQVFNHAVGVGEAINGKVLLDKALYLKKSLTLTHGITSFSLGFSALQFANPNANQYAYRLIGVDQDWVGVDASRRTATYTNLPAGNYRFEVKASNSDGIWNEEATVLELRILPPWWLTTWAYMFYTILVFVAGYLIFRYIRARQGVAHTIAAERFRTQFFTQVSHEFRTPLTLIIDPLEQLISGTADPDQIPTYYKLMRRNAVRLLSLINQLLDWRKVEENKFTLQVVEEDIVAYVGNIVAAFEFQASQAGIQLQYLPAHGSLLFGFDPDIVEKISYNLLSNALKFTPAGGSIRLSLATDKNHNSMVIKVCDNGQGIPQEAVKKIFDPFFQVESNTSKKWASSGVGLSLVRELVKQHQGHIEVESVPAKETCFTVYLQNMKDHVSEVISPLQHQVLQTTEAPETAEISLQAQAEQPVLLIVEDHEDVQNYLLSIFNKHYQLLVAGDGEEGLRLAKEHVPDLIISDVMMPKMDGLQLCSAIKTTELTSHIPVILLTARQSEEHQIEGFETGADAYVSKPFSSAILQVRVRNLLDSRMKLRERFAGSSTATMSDQSMSAVDRAFLEKFTSLVEQNLSNEQADVAWFASEMYLGRTQLYRKIKAITGQTTQELITLIRLKQASLLLKNPELSVAEVAHQVGYADATSFGRAFQKQYNLTPKKYRDQA